MLKKIAITGAVSALAMLGVSGVAYADTHHHHRGHTKTDCSSHESTRQSNKGKQLVGGNVIGRDINGFIGGSIDKGAFCPSLFNDIDD